MTLFTEMGDAISWEGEGGCFVGAEDILVETSEGRWRRQKEGGHVGLRLGKSSGRSPSRPVLMGRPGPVYLGRQHQREEASRGPGMQIAGGPPPRA